MLTRWGYGIISVDVLDIDNWFRGKSNDCEIKIESQLGFENFEFKKFITNYNNGNLYDMKSHRSDGNNDENPIKLLE